jgi:hypothetical protein
MKTQRASSILQDWFERSAWLGFARCLWLAVAGLVVVFLLVHYPQASRTFTSGANLAALTINPENVLIGFPLLGWPPVMFGLVSLAVRTAAVCVLFARVAGTFFRFHLCHVRSRPHRKLHFPDSILGDDQLAFG